MALVEVQITNQIPSKLLFGPKKTELEGVLKNCSKKAQKKLTKNAGASIWHTDCRMGPPNDFRNPPNITLVPDRTKIPK